MNPALYGWKNSRVVASQKAVRLAQAADLTISAVGYNSFHEAMYHRIPTIFVPQVAPFMDDQERRGRAAEDRGLASFVAPDDLLRLTREIDTHLDGGRCENLRDALAGLDLPETGKCYGRQIDRGAFEMTKQELLAILSRLSPHEPAGSRWRYFRSARGIFW